MRPQSVTVTGVATSAWIPLDTKQTPFNVGLGVVINSGTATYTVQHTFNNVLAGETATAFDNATLAGDTTNQDGNYAFPVAAVRLNVTVSSGGTVTLHVLQGSKA